MSVSAYKGLILDGRLVDVGSIDGMLGALRPFLRSIQREIALWVETR